MKKLFIPIVLVLSSLTIRAQQAPEKTVTLKLTVTQVNLILTSLSDRKLAESIETYLDIRMQTISQLNPVNINPDSANLKIDTTKPVAKKPKETKSLPH